MKILKVSKRASAALIHIEELQRLLLVYRYLYYVMSESLVSDERYDSLEKMLRDTVVDSEKISPTLYLRSLYYKICPLRTPGSSLDKTYPSSIRLLAKATLAYKQEEQKRKLKIVVK